MYQYKSEADHEARKSAVLILGICDTENSENKDERENDLNNQTGDKASTDARKSVCAEAAGHISHSAQQEDNGKNRCAHK